VTLLHNSLASMDGQSASVGAVIQDLPATNAMTVIPVSSIGRETTPGFTTEVTDYLP